MKYDNMRPMQYIRTFFLFMFIAYSLVAFTPPIFSCELYISPSNMDINQHEKQTITISRQIIHKKCKQDVSGIVINAENCQIESQTDWVVEGFNWKKEVVVLFPTTGDAYITISNTCELFPIRPYKAVFHVKELIQEDPIPPPPITTEPSPPPATESPAPETPPVESNPIPLPVETKPQPSIQEKPPSPPSVAPVLPTANISTPSPGSGLSDPPVASELTTQNAESEISKTSEKAPASQQKWSDYFMKYEFYTLIMLLFISIILNISFQNKFRYLINLVSLGYLGFYTGGCLCTIGLVEKVPLFGFSTPLGIFSVVFLSLLFVLSMVFGRVFCGWICPHGVLQEFLFRFPVISHSKKKKFPWTIVLPGFVFFSVFMISFIWKISLLCEYDPFKIPFQLSGTILLLIFFSLVGFTALFFHRPFCKYVCPLGFLLGLASWLGEKLKIRWIGKSVECENCSVCRKTCLSEALRKKGTSLQIDAFSCIECGSCHEKCSIQQKRK
ncbi:4Fe-4S binding protein [bacterium]|nr:4Fe-4S binding protein [bacterium]